MTATETTTAAEIRSQLDHPVIDADGHTIEILPVLLEFIREEGGDDLLERFETSYRTLRPTTYEERRDSRRDSPLHWVWPGNTLDRATAALPRLYHERMDELGLDVSLVYPTLALRMHMLADDGLRPALCRAVNRYMAEVHAGLSDRLLPVAAIPMHTPQEAIDEIEYAVDTLGMRAVLLPSYVRRPIPSAQREHGVDEDVAYWFDTYGIDSEYDYDPVWAKCIELKVVPGVHTPSHGDGFRRSISNYVYNHIGSFATSCEALCKSLVMGGVFHRFPQLKIAALEGGVGWAASLYADFLGHWEKRNGKVIHDLDPERLDRDRLTSLLSAYGGDRVRATLDATLASIANTDRVPYVIDEFEACPFASPEEFRDLFVSHIYIGCEADDPMNALAFDERINPMGARFRILFGSDISHWDVPDVSRVLEEAHELVERELITEQDFEAFTFTNAAHLYTSVNPDFFRGTRVEADVAEFVGAG
jgi:predicted TIM-barrel fold metal-dependent hydrolase